jgi:hypothetical protein
MSGSRAARLAEIFKEVDLPEITGIDFGATSPEEVAMLLPSYGGKHPLKAILVDRKTGKAYGIASGWDAETVTYNGMEFKAGAVTPEMAVQAGASWEGLGHHVELVAAAFMRKEGITDAVVYINGRNPCWGRADAPGCFYKMSEFLAEGSRMIVFNKYGSNFVNSWPDRKFDFTGLPD